MDVFQLHKSLIQQYGSYSRSFINIQDERIRTVVGEELDRGLLWPEPLVQLNPSYQPGPTVDDLCTQRHLHPDCQRIFRIKKHEDDFGSPLTLYQHQAEAIAVAKSDRPYVLTTGTGSGKSLSFIIPIVDHVLRQGSGHGIQSIIVYPMNALANSQVEELDKFLKRGLGGQDVVTYARYTGQEREEEKRRILDNPPDILLTNYVMLELILTRVDERRLVRHARELKYLVFDELHTYRGRQGADVAMLIRRCRQAFSGDELLCVGTSATMASGDDLGIAEQKRTVAKVATKLFGAPLAEDQVIGETLVRGTAAFDSDDPGAVEALRSSANWFRDQTAQCSRETLVDKPLAGWLESNLGLRVDAETGALVRAKPKPIAGPGGLAHELAAITGLEPSRAFLALRRCLELGAGTEPRPVFAFRLHQFITRGDTVYASLEPISERTLSLRPLRFDAQDPEKRLFPLCFCRSCGQEYFRVDAPADPAEGPWLPRDRFEKTQEEEVESGYLYYSERAPWPEDEDEVLDRLPSDWLEGEGEDRKVSRNRRKSVPELVILGADGKECNDGLQAAFFPTPFRFCLNPECGKAFSFRQRSDQGKLATLGVDGRSTATTILGLTVLMYLQEDDDLASEARKLLSFTDNRQDASLQAGHFNDFIAVSLVRSALFRAMTEKGKAGLRHSELPAAVQECTSLPVELFAGTSLRGAARESASAAFRQVLEYHLYRDFQGGWRVVSPNLERCGLLRVEYLGLDEMIGDEAYWGSTGFHSSLVGATPEVRERVIRALLDHLRRNLVIKHELLTKIGQERLVAETQQWLADPWQVGDDQELEQAGMAWDGTQPGRQVRRDLSLSAQSGFGQLLARELQVQSMEERSLVIAQLLSASAETWGLLEKVRERDERSAYQLRAAAIVWHEADGDQLFWDPLREVEASQTDPKKNNFFHKFYREFATIGRVFEGREHTAQVQADVREERERRFRSGELPLLFCSPTMELGIDISLLNVVNMRNVPPTPANYAQRSGRAGRGGQPALVFTYCSGFSPHDQYYFRQPDRMVAGSVTEPRLDLGNEDLVRAHVHAIWLAEAGVHLGKTLTEVLQVSEANLELPLREEIREQLADGASRLSALQVAKEVLARVEGIQEASWWREDWVEDVLQVLPQAFDHACDRWRSLYRSAVQQRLTQNGIIGDHSRPASDRQTATRLRAQAEAQIRLLTDARSAAEGDFYSYRYFASEGFLPGYNFPRLPISAFIPGRQRARGRDEFLSRPRFLAISEFGPHALIYHEGRRYEIHKVNLAFDSEQSDLVRQEIRLCDQCGYGHLVKDPPGADVCTGCGAPLDEGTTLRDLVQLQNVTARPRERINSNEEERSRKGYELRTTLEFLEGRNYPGMRSAELVCDGEVVAHLSYGTAARIIQINQGPRNRREGRDGFLLEKETGRWVGNRTAEDRQDPDAGPGRETIRVVPYVEDRRNALVLNFPAAPTLEEMATLQAALKQAILKEYQLESGELAVVPLPRSEDRRSLLFYEASEGGAGVLRHFVDQSQALASLAKAALGVCHLDPESGADLAPEGTCSRACDECLLDYGNQRDHDLLDRQAARSLLLKISRSQVEAQGPGRSRAEHIRSLLANCDSELERKWLRMVEEERLALPSHGQYLIESANTKPDFYYDRHNAAVYIDGPPHDTEEGAVRDREVDQALTEAGYLCIRFHHTSDWSSVVREYPSVFGLNP